MRATLNVKQYEVIVSYYGNNITNKNVIKANQLFCKI